MVYLDKYYLTDGGLLYDSLMRIWIGRVIDDIRSFTFTFQS